MKCCADCFGDRGLRKQIIPMYSDSTGICSFCGTNGVELVKPERLVNEVGRLVSIYTPEKSGKSLVEWLKEDWRIFTHEKMDVAHSKALLSQILKDEEIVRENFVPSRAGDTSRLDSWEQLSKELMYENRFFPMKEIDFDRLEGLLSHLLLDPEEWSQNEIWYRARIQLTEDGKYSVDEMGPPPKRLASQGRANPAGIPYLYFASTPDTAVSEVRPHTGEFVSVANMSVGPNLKVIDLRNPRSTVSPFLLSDENEIALLREDIGFLVELGKELTKPVLPHAAAIDYIPSQFLCEFIKRCGYHGVLYDSSVGEGVNFSLFDPNNATVSEINCHHVTRVTVKSQPYNQFFHSS